MDEDEKMVFEDETTDFYDEFKDRMRQDPLKSVLGQRTQQTRQTSGVVTVLIGVVLAALVVWYVIEKYFTSAEADPGIAPPSILADEELVKVRPENIGGMEIVGKDKSVYGRIGQARQQEPERIIRREEAPAPVADEDDDDEVEVSVPVASALVIKEKSKEAPLPEVEPTLPKALVDNAVSGSNVKIVTEPEKAKAVPIYTPPKAVETVVAQPLNKDKWKIQLLSSREETAVKKSWENIKSKNSDLVGKLPHEIVPADLGDRGRFYRLRIGEFTDRKDADELCRQLKVRKLDCLVVK